VFMPSAPPKALGPEQERNPDDRVSMVFAFFRLLLGIVKTKDPLAARSYLS